VRALSVLAFLALAGSATAAVLAGGVLAGGGEPSARASAVAAEGSFSFANSRDGMPIFSATEIAPGDSVSGTVEIADTGTEPGDLTLAQHDVADAPGPGGGELSKRLTLRVTDVTAPASPVAVYAGPLAPMPAQPAGELEPGASRTYEFVATLPAGAGAQNDVQGASASVAYSWTAGEVGTGPGSGPAPSPTPSPAQPPSSAPPDAAGSAPPAAAPLRLTITRVRHAIRHGRLVIWARCDRACSVSVRGRLRARGVTGHRSAKLHLSPRHNYKAGRQRLPLRIPHKLRRWLAANPDRLHFSVRVALLARDPAGDQAALRRALRVRAVTGSAFARGSTFARGSGFER
jgi:hypothetical protein